MVGATKTAVSNIVSGSYHRHLITQFKKNLGIKESTVGAGKYADHLFLIVGHFGSQHPDVGIGQIQAVDRQAGARLTTEGLLFGFSHLFTP